MCMTKEVTQWSKIKNVSSDVHYCYSIKALVHVLADINSYLEFLELTWHSYECSTSYNSQNGWTALMSASHNGHSNVVETLLQHGASVDQQKDVSTGDVSCHCLHKVVH